MTSLWKSVLPSERLPNEALVCYDGTTSDLFRGSPPLESLPVNTHRGGSDLVCVHSTCVQPHCWCCCRCYCQRTTMTFPQGIGPSLPHLPRTSGRGPAGVKNARHSFTLWCEGVCWAGGPTLLCCQWPLWSGWGSVWAGNMEFLYMKKKTISYNMAINNMFLLCVIIGQCFFANTFCRLDRTLSSTAVAMVSATWRWTQRLKL